MLSLTPLGTNGLYPTDKPTSGYLVKGDNAAILLDIGSGVFACLINAIDVKSLNALVISHFHFDHASDIGVLKYYLESNGLKLKVFAPLDDSPLCKVVMGSKCFDFTPIHNLQKVEINGLLLNFYQVNHPVLTFGVKITDGVKTLAYTADTNLCDNLDNLLSGADLALMDCCILNGMWKESSPHLSAKLCAELGKKHGVNVLLTHLKPNLNQTALLYEAKHFYPNCELALLKEYTL